MRGQVVSISVIRQCDRPEIVDHGVVLATERQGAVLVALQADVRLAAEHRTRVGLTAILDVKAAFEAEDRMQVVAEVFAAFEAPDFVRQHAALFLPRALAALVIRIDDTGVDQTIKRDAALRMSRHGKDGQSSCADNFLFHSIPNRNEAGRA